MEAKTKMTNIDIDDEVYIRWVEFYKRNSKLEYPTMKNFTARKLDEIISTSNGGGS